MFSGKKNFGSSDSLVEAIKKVSDGGVLLDPNSIEAKLIEEGFVRRVSRAWDDSDDQIDRLCEQLDESDNLPEPDLVSVIEELVEEGWSLEDIDEQIESELNESVWGRAKYYARKLYNPFRDGAMSKQKRTVVSGLARRIERHKAAADRNELQGYRARDQAGFHKQEATRFGNVAKYTSGDKRARMLDTHASHSRSAEYHDRASNRGFSASRSSNATVNRARDLRARLTAVRSVKH